VRSNGNNQISELPEDLSSPAIKAARRLQSLSHGRLHLLAFFKIKGAWFLALIANGIKLEKLTKR